MLFRLFESSLEKARRNERVIWQSSFLLGSQVLLLIIGFGVKSIQTHALDAGVYGLYALFGTIISFTVVFFSFGLLESIQVMLAETEDRKKAAGLAGIGLLITVALGLIYFILIWVISFFVDGWFEVEFGSTLRLFSPLCWVFPFRHYLSGYAVGSNRVQIIPINDITAKGLFILLLLFYFLRNELDLELILFFNLLTLILALVPVIAIIKPAFTDLRERFREVVVKLKQYGRHVYLGSIAQEGTLRLDEVLVALFVSPLQLGYFTLAALLGSPLSMFSEALNQAMFKRYATAPRIPSLVFISVIGTGLVYIGLMILLSDHLVHSLFGPGYSEVASYAIWLSLAFFLRSISRSFVFLAAKSLGKDLRNISVSQSVFGLICSLTLIPWLGVHGAILSAILTRAFGLAIRAYYYIRYLRSASSGKAPHPQ